MKDNHIELQSGRYGSSKAAITFEVRLCLRGDTQHGRTLATYQRAEDARMCADWFAESLKLPLIKTGPYFEDVPAPIPARAAQKLVVKSALLALGLFALPCQAQQQVYSTEQLRAQAQAKGIPELSPADQEYRNNTLNLQKATERWLDKTPPVYVAPPVFVAPWDSAPSVPSQGGIRGTLDSLFPNAPK